LVLGGSESGCKQDEPRERREERLFLSVAALLRFVPVAIDLIFRRNYLCPSNYDNFGISV
jgi:hypothetical protein